MRVLFVSQGAFLRVFDSIATALAKDPSEKFEFYHIVSDRRFFHQFSKSKKMKNESGFSCEWQMLEKALTSTPVAESTIKGIEKRLQVESLWPYLIADRRYANGPLAKVRDDYRSKFSLSQLQNIAVSFVEGIEKAFDEFNPDVVVSFSPSTVLGFLVSPIAKSRGVPCLTVKSTKISNFVTLTTDPLEGHPHIKNRFREELLKLKNNQAPSTAQALLFRDQVQKSRLKYEGALQTKKRVGPIKGFFQFLKSAPRNLALDLRENLKFKFRDTQLPPVFLSGWYTNVVREYKMKAFAKRFQNLLAAPIDLQKMDYVFFPLNSEPEIALSVYSRFTLNQIEVVRNIAQSVSLSTKIVVKEHPRSFGVRSLDFYEKLLEIPNVVLVHPETPTPTLIEHCRLTAVISSFVGFESLIQGRPVLAFGHTAYSCLPESMVKVIHSFEELPSIFANHSFDRNFGNAPEILAFISACMLESEPIDLYSKMLAKSGRERGSTNQTSENLDLQYENFARYLLKRIHEVSREKSNLQGKESSLMAISSNPV